MPALPDFRLETYFSRWEFAARYNLTASDAQTMSLAELLERAEDEGRARWESLHLGYTETYGLPALREAIAGGYQHAAAEDVLCFAGAEEAIYLAMQVLLGPGDHAVVVTPNYQAAETVPLSICEVTGVALRPEEGWTLDLHGVEAALRPATRVVSVTFPHTPTRAVPDEETWRGLRLPPPLPGPGRGRGHVRRSGGAGGHPGAAGERLPRGPDSRASGPVARRGRPPGVAGGSRPLGRLAGQAPITSPQPLAVYGHSASAMPSGRAVVIPCSAAQSRRSRPSMAAAIMGGNCSGVQAKTAQPSAAKAPALAWS